MMKTLLTFLNLFNKQFAHSVQSTKVSHNNLSESVVVGLLLYGILVVVGTENRTKLMITIE